MCIWTELFYINLFVWIFMVKKILELGFFGDAIINFIVFEKKDFYRHYFEFVFATRRFSTFQLNWNTNTCRGPCDRVLNTLIYLFISSWLIWCCLLLLAFSNQFICVRRIPISSLEEGPKLRPWIRVPDDDYLNLRMKVASNKKNDSKLDKSSDCCGWFHACDIEMSK